MRALVDRQGRMPLRLARMVSVVLAVLLLAQVAPVAAQKGGIQSSSTPAPEGTPGTMLDLDPSALDDLGGLLESPDGGSREGVPGQVVNDEYGFTIDYQSPWQSYGTWDRDGVEQEYFIDSETEAAISVTAWEWAGVFTIQDTVAWWASPENMAEWMPDGQVLQVRTGDTAGAVVFYHPPTTEYPDSWLYVAELHVYDGYAVEIGFSSDVSVFGGAYPVAGESVLVNAVPAVGVYSTNEILAAVPAT